MMHETWHECRNFPAYQLKNNIKFHFIRNKQIVILHKNINHDKKFIIYDIDFYNALIQIKNAFKNNQSEHTNYYIMFMGDWIDLKKQILERFKGSYADREKYFDAYSIEEVLNDFNYWYSEITYDGKVKCNHPELFTIYKSQLMLLQDGNNF